MSTRDTSRVPRKTSDIDINTARAHSDDWRVATAEIYHADPLYQMTILCRLFSRGCFPEDVQAALTRLNFPTHHYVFTIPPKDVDEADVALLETLDLCTVFHSYIRSIRWNLDNPNASRAEMLAAFQDTPPASSNDAGDE